MARRASGVSFGILLAHAVLMPGAVLMVLPMLWMLVTSFKPAPEIAVWPPHFLPRAPTFENYVGLFQAAPFGRYFLNSVGIALASTLAVVGDLDGGRRDLRQIPLPRPHASSSA